MEEEVVGDLLHWIVVEAGGTMDELEGEIFGSKFSSFCPTPLCLVDQPAERKLQ